MTTYAPAVPSVTAAALTLHPAAAGDKISGISKPRTMIVYNASVASITATIDPPGNTEYGVATPAKVQTCPAGAYSFFTLLPLYRNPSDSDLVAVVWSATATVSWAVLD